MLRTITAGSPKVTLPPLPSIVLLLVLHELTTNAMKHGALSQRGGKVAVTWRLDDPFILVTGYPGVASDGPPMRSAPRIVKPFTLEQLAEEMQKAFATNR